MAPKRKSPANALSLRVALRLAWKRGLLEYKLFKHQKEFYKILKKAKSRKTVINASRRWGKTTVALIYCVIFATNNPGSLVRFVAPTQKSLRKIIFPIMKMLLQDCPEELKPRWNVQDGCYYFKNDSELHLYGTDNQNHDGLRGQRCDLGVIDEAAYCSDLMYIVQDILLPQTLTCDGRIIILSTPQKKTTQSGEEFKQLCTEAELNGSYFTKTIYDNKALTPTKIEEYKRESGGEDSITWQVEYLCRFIIDPEKRIIPEWNDAFVQKFETDNYFPYYHKYFCMDLGVKRDFTCMILGHYDFLKGILYVHDEVTMKNMTSHDLVQALKKKEKQCFGSYPIYRRIADSDNPLLLNDLCSLHNIGIMPTGKSTLETMVNELRVFVGDGRVIVHPKCKFLSNCLKLGVWADNAQGKMRKDFGRTKDLGHFDGVAALMYLVRNLDTTTNPIPSLYGVDPNNSHIFSTQRETNHELSKLFKKRFR